jgi:predicted ATPase
MVVSKETLNILRIAACFGDIQFSLRLLSRVMNASPLYVANKLKPAEEAGFITSSEFVAQVKS